MGHLPTVRCNGLVASSRCDPFTDVRQSRMERGMRDSARDYVCHLSTVSAHLELPDPVREQMLGLVLTVLPEQVAGGR